MRSMERPTLLSWVIPILAAASAVVTGWASHNMQMTLGTAAICYGILLALAVGAWKLQMRAWGRQESRRAQEVAAAHKAFLDERIKCEGGCYDPWQPRRTFYELSGQRGIPLPYVCPVCYSKITGTMPYANPLARRAFDQRQLLLPVALPRSGCYQARVVASSGTLPAEATCRTSAKRHVKS
jgi:hypothetical protein